jgi:hypothetical protein
VYWPIVFRRLEKSNSVWTYIYMSVQASIENFSHVDRSVRPRVAFNFKRNALTAQIEILDISGRHMLQQVAAFNQFADAFSTQVQIHHQRGPTAYQHAQNDVPHKTEHSISLSLTNSLWSISRSLAKHV